MNDVGTITPALTKVLEDLRTELQRLNDRVAVLERSLTAKANGAPPVLTEELVTVLSAAIAGYLGYLPKIRQIRLVGGAGWAQQGRVTIQASHKL